MSGYLVSLIRSFECLHIVHIRTTLMFEYRFFFEETHAQKHTQTHKHTQTQSQTQNQTQNQTQTQTQTHIPGVSSQTVGGPYVSIQPSPLPA